MTISELSSDEYNPYYQSYLDKVGEGDVLELLRGNCEKMRSFVENIANDKLDFRYAEGKWSIKEIILHIIDTERVFAYRALRIARNDKTELSGFDHDDFVLHSHADARSLESLMSEYKCVRMATMALFESFDNNSLAKSGIASNSKISVRAIAFILVGHENHHLQIIEERYL